MALPVSKQELADWILRRLGAPVVNVEITDVQLEDVIDEAVQWFQEWHYDGAERVYRTIKIDQSTLLGNNRPSIVVNASMFDASIQDTYRMGDRVMTYTTNERPDKIWVKYDSEEKLIYLTYFPDTNGNYFVSDSDQPADLTFIRDPSARDHIDSEGAFVVYDSDAHTTYMFSVTTAERVNYFKRDAESVVSVVGVTYVDSDGVKVPYNVAQHSAITYRNVYDSDAPYVFFGGSYVAYDSDAHTPIVYVDDVSGAFVRDSDSDWVVYNPVTHADNWYTNRRARRYAGDPRRLNYYVVKDPRWVYESDALGLWVIDSEGEYVLFDSDTKTHWRNDYYVVVDSDYRVDSDRRFGRSLYVRDSEGTFVLYDSDNPRHTNYIYLPGDSDDVWVQEQGIGRWVLWSVDSDAYLKSPRFRRFANLPTLYYPAYDEEIPQKQRWNRHYNRFTWFEDVLWTDSDGLKVVYDSDKHFDWVETALGRWVIDSEGAYIRYDSDRHALSIVPDSDGYLVDSEGEYIPYDSDAHNIYRFTTKVAIGDSDHLVWVVDSEGNFVRYDSDEHVITTATVNPQGIYTDSEDGLKVLWDSDRYTLFRYYVNNTNGRYVDSDGTYVFFDSDKHTPSTRYSLDSYTNNTRYDLDHKPPANFYFRYTQKRVRFRINNYKEIKYVTDSENNGTWVLDSDGLGGDTTYRPYDSDSHNDYRYLLDSEGYWILDSDRKVSVYNPIIHNRLSKERRLSRFGYTKQRYMREYVPYTRFEKNFGPYLHYLRTTGLKGARYSRTSNSFVRKVYSWSDLWKEEQAVLREPVLDLDYSKEGQVGVPIPENIIGINKVFRIDNFSGMGMWNYEYQYFLNNFDFFYGSGGASSMPITNYYITKQYIEFIDQMMNVQPAIRFSKHRNRLYLDTNWARLEKMSSGKNYYLMLEAYEVNDPDVFGDIYKDKWLKRYATALAKVQWGSNLKKYSNAELPGGLQLDGQALYNEGKEEQLALEEELKNSQLEMDWIVG